MGALLTHCDHLNAAVAVSTYQEVIRHRLLAKGDVWSGGIGGAKSGRPDDNRDHDRIPLDPELSK